MAQWWEEQGYESESEAIRDGAKKPRIFESANSRRDTYFKDINTPQEYFNLISGPTYEPTWTTTGELYWVTRRFGVDFETARNYRDGIFPEEPKDLGTFPRLVISEAAQKANIVDETTGEVISQVPETSLPDDALGLERLNATLSIINAQLNNYENFNEYITERPQDIERFVKDQTVENVEIIPEGEQEGFVLRIGEDGKLVGFDEKTGKEFNPYTEEFLEDTEEVEEVEEQETQKDIGISNDWNTNGSNIINLNGNRYALFEKGGSFRSAGSEDEFNDILGQGFTPIGNQNPIWLNFAQSENLDDIEIIVSDNLSYDTPTGTSTGSGQIIKSSFTEFNNIPNNGLLWDVGGSFYIVYEVPGSNGEVYDGNPVYLAYEVAGNDLVNAGVLSPNATAPQPNARMDQAFFDSIAIVTGNTDQLSAEIDNPFASFVETITEQSQVAPWITDPEMLSLIAEAAVEGRTVSDAEWQTTNWYQTHSESEREWLRTYYEDPASAAQSITDGQIAIANALQASGVANAPEALVNWLADKFVTGQWTQNYTTEQISLFADPYATGKRDTDFESYLTSTAITGVDRTSQREAEVRDLYAQYLGPVLGKVTDSEAAELAGRLRNDPDFKDQLIAGLKQSRLAAFSNYTNPELTYEDIARPWRNLTASIWGQSADETQGWWQEMVKTNDFAKAEEILRTKGLELDITQVTQDASTALTQALGQGNISQLGVNV